MEAEKTNVVADTIAFLLARINGDADAAVAILGENDTFSGAELLMGMTDLAYSMAQVLATLTGNSAEGLVKAMAMANKYSGGI